MDSIELLEPANGAVTEPLQRHHLPTDSDGAGDLDPVGGGARAWENLQVVAMDRSVPKPVTFAWTRLPWRWRSVTYDLTLATTPTLDQNPIVLRDLSKPTIEVWHLFIGTPYYWTVRARHGQEVVAESPVWRFVTNSLPPRWIRVPGVTNVRDLGGWPLPHNRRVRQGLVYRSSEMNGNLRVTPRGRQVLEDELRIRTDLDLRGEHEGAAPALDPVKVRWIHAPISPYDCICDVAFAEGYRRIFETFADPANYPILFHCVGGADRGGTVAFLLNALLGKSREHLIRDYELTTLSVWGERSWTSEQFLSLLEVLKPFGGDPQDLTRQVEHYLLSIGLSPAALAEIRKRLITESPAPHGG
ncbi:MAG: tyrosine-protein phosphatase [Lentisphaerae bacterium]|nr:tyrosine-protein phosphatase [Lentisphaerota bacterium]